MRQIRETPEAGRMAEGVMKLGPFTNSKTGACDPAVTARSSAGAAQRWDASPHW